jgi:uncharacterized protein
MAQTWTDLLFAQWSVPASALTPVVPPQFSLDTFDGRAWIAVTPFCGAQHASPADAIPLLSAFPAINVRTYVSVGGKPGIYLFSLDAAGVLTVATARAHTACPTSELRCQ